jgi:4-amino-4-deoxy-L-arabinose transferase
LELDKNTVLFNVKGRHYIEAMFYTGLPAYNVIPTIEQYHELKAKDRKIAVFDNRNTSIPDYLQNDPAVIIIEKELLGFN